MDSHLCGYFSPPRLGCYVLGVKHPTEEQAFDRITAYTVERGRGHRVDTYAPGANPQDRRLFASLQTRRRSPEGYILMTCFAFNECSLGAKHVSSAPIADIRSRLESGHSKPKN
ncbi:MAG: hypothetical protein O3B99_06480 [Proteobacteria bacterium]|nr:hypothetical protein [Pseudomonadota bacterium]MDA1321920.1 hypothetical protein [Pseudomonadota bacterium]